MVVAILIPKLLQRKENYWRLKERLCNDKRFNPPRRHCNVYAPNESEKDMKQKLVRLKGKI